MAANPMSQFDVYRIGPEIKVGAFDISFTNASLFMIISTVSILLVFNLGSIITQPPQIAFLFHTCITWWVHTHQVHRHQKVSPS